MNTYESVTATLKSNIVHIEADGDKIQVRLSSLIQHAKDAGMNLLSDYSSGEYEEVELDARTYVLENLDEVAASYVEFNLMVA
jgi:DNA integrity scanning protein DisA with diadenylate cyclase activity